MQCTLFTEDVAPRWIARTRRQARRSVGRPVCGNLGARGDPNQPPQINKAASSLQPSGIRSDNSAEADIHFHATSMLVEYSWTSTSSEFSDAILWNSIFFSMSCFRVLTKRPVPYSAWLMTPSTLNLHFLGPGADVCRNMRDPLIPKVRGLPSLSSSLLSSV